MYRSDQCFNANATWDFLAVELDLVIGEGLRRATGITVYPLYANGLKQLMSRGIAHGVIVFEHE